MTTDLIDRRVFLAAGGASFLASLSPNSTLADEKPDAIFASAFYTHGARFGAAIFAEDGKIISELILPARGHDVVFSPLNDGIAVVFARRPGTFAFAFSASRGIKPVAISTPANRHFYGHGCFSHDGTWLFATENDFGRAKGKIGIYNTREGFRRVGEFETFGIGPHEILLTQDGETLVVANGGIETHPEFGRAKLNLTSIQPSIVLIDANDGSLKTKFLLPPENSKLSLRHMDMDSTGKIWIAGQLQSVDHRHPLVATVTQDRGLELVNLDENLTRSLRGYIGSISINKLAKRVAIASPKSGILVEFPTYDPTRIQIRKVRKINGIAPQKMGFVLTSSDGDFVSASNFMQTGQRKWDNHLAGRF